MPIFTLEGIAAVLHEVNAMWGHAVDGMSAPQKERHHELMLSFAEDVRDFFKKLQPK